MTPGMSTFINTMRTGSSPDLAPCFPRTRYQGSKRKLAAAIVAHTKHLEFTSVLDAFGGTGAVAHAFKCAGKAVTYNDILAFNHQIGLALIANEQRRLSEDELDGLLTRHAEVNYGDTIARWFDGIYFTREENRWLDMMVANIKALPDLFARALAWHALFQAALAKRPYNLFHRRNLYMREAVVPRSFGNKTTWDRPFPDHFLGFAREAHRAVFRGNCPCQALQGDVLHIPRDFDLVYIDPPYMNARGQTVDYHHFYHFLEGMMDYDHWPQLMDLQSKHRRLPARPTIWSDPDRITEAFRAIFERFSEAILVVSYRSDGIPSLERLSWMLSSGKRHVTSIKLSTNPYALSTNRLSSEILIIASLA